MTAKLMVEAMAVTRVRVESAVAKSAVPPVVVVARSSAEWGTAMLAEAVAVVIAGALAQAVEVSMAAANPVLVTAVEQMATTPLQPRQAAINLRSR